MGQPRNRLAFLAVVALLLVNLDVCCGSTTPDNATAASGQTALTNSQILSTLQRLVQNPKSVGSLLQSVVPTLTNILRSSISGTNATVAQTSPVEAFLRKMLLSLVAGGNGSSGSLQALEAQAVGAVKEYINEPIVKAALPIVTQIVMLLREEIISQSNGSFPPMSALPNALGSISLSAIAQRMVDAGIIQKIIETLPHGKVNDECARDTVDTLVSLVSMKKWALDMFDATGKIESGLQKGHFYFIGSYDQCYGAEPKIETTSPLAGGHTRTRTFGTRFCRADINIPESLVKSLNVDTRGVKLKLTWGLCVPDSCKSKDVRGLFDIGSVYNVSLPMGRVHCYEEEKIESDTSAIVAICILSLFALLIATGTFIDACRAYFATDGSTFSVETTKPSELGGVSSGKYKKAAETYGLPSVNYTSSAETKEPLPLTTNMVKENGISNNAFIADTRENGDVNGAVNYEKADLAIALPPGYVPHRETGIEITKSDRSPSLGTVQQQNAEQIHKITIQRKDSLVVRLLLCFSVYTNIPKILHAKGSSGSVACIHGIRFFSLTWVVLGHTYNYGIISMEETLNAENLLDFVGIIQRFTFQTVVAGGFAVDTFFVLSAFLLTWLHLKDTAKKKKKCTLGNFIYFYFHRFWRLTPIYMLVLMSFACLYKYLGSGPMWPSTITTAENCKHNWWVNLLYVNNLVHVDNQCMGWSWYLANDMQFYVVSPIFLFAMIMSPVLGAILTGILLAVGMACAFWKEYIYNGNFFTMKEDGGDYWRQVYIVPWCRVGCWAVGMLLGLLVYYRKGKPLRNKIIVRLGWLLAAGVALFLVYIPYTEQKKDGQEWTRVERAFYEGFGRPAWGVCIAWLILACHSGKGGIVNTILSWNGFIPLSRLTYAAYLVHPICMMVNVWSRRTLLYVNDYTIIYLFLGHLCMTYMVAFVCSLAFEAPFMGLEKVLFRRGRRS